MKAIIGNGVLRVILGFTLCGFSSSCMTAYDAYGRPIQVVDPAVAAAGIIAAGAVGYAVASEANNHDNYHSDDYYYAGSILPYIRPLFNARYVRPYPPPEYGYGYGGGYAPSCIY